MQDTSVLYNTIIKNPLHSTEVRVTINGVSYDESKIISCIVKRSLFSGSNLAVGGAVAKELSLKVYPDNRPIPRSAQITVSVRLRYQTLVSEWVSKGTFYIDTRSIDKTTGQLSITAYDDMIKADVVWWDPSESVGEFPMPMLTAIEDIAARMGVEIDERSTIATGKAYVVEYPNDYTMREILSHVAAANAGNWVITDQGKLLLVRLNDIPVESFLLVDETGDIILFGEDIAIDVE